MQELLAILQWFLRGIVFFGVSLIYVAILTSFGLIIFGTLKLIFNTIKKILQKE